MRLSPSKVIYVCRPCSDVSQNERVSPRRPGRPQYPGDVAWRGVADQQTGSANWATRCLRGRPPHPAVDTTATCWPPAVRCYRMTPDINQRDARTDRATRMTPSGGTWPPRPATSMTGDADGNFHAARCRASRRHRRLAQRPRPRRQGGQRTRCCWVDGSRCPRRR